MVSAERTQILKAYGCTFLKSKDIPGVVELIKEEGLLLTKKCLNFSFCLGNCFKVKTNVLT